MCLLPIHRSSLKKRLSKHFAYSKIESLVFLLLSCKSPFYFARHTADRSPPSRLMGPLQQPRQLSTPVCGRQAAKAWAPARLRSQEMSRPLASAAQTQACLLHLLQT